MKNEQKKSTDRIDMYRLRILAQSVIAIFVAVSAAVHFRGYGRVPLVLLLLACVSTLWLVSCRTTWLPFLGPSAMPTSVFRPFAPEDAELEITMEAPPSAVRVVYWASSVRADDPVRAYGGYSNAGVADVDEDTGVVVLFVMTPKPYAVGGSTLAPHVHYRWVTARGMLSSVKTLYI